MVKKHNYDGWTEKDYQKEIGRLEKQKTYGLVWEEDKTKEDIEDEGKFPVLKEVKNKEIKNKDSKYNLMIEGDNYHALAVLNFTHNKAIDVIYIDPPYNTGNNDFLYNDKFVEMEDSFRHSKWLSFMSKRLKLAKNLLKKEGIIFISIDDNEYAQLKILCDEIFTEKNYISTIVWQKVYSPKNQSKRISIDHEYVLCYARNINYADFKLLPRTEEMDKRYKNPDNDSRGLWQSGDLVANEERKKGHYIVKGPKGDKFDAPLGKHWSVSQENMNKLIKENRVWFGKNDKSFPRIKQFLSEVQQGRKASTLFFHKEAGHTDEGKKELKMFFEQSDELFSTPKPTRLIKNLLRLIKNKDALVLDFFVGSGTTAQATLSLNKEDKGNRKFIVCTNNENDICSKVCYPRIEKSIKGFVDTKNLKRDALGGNLKYFKTDFVDSALTDQNKKKIVDKSTEMLCIKENAFKLIVDKKGFKIFKNTDLYLGIIFDDEKIEDFVKEAKNIKGKFSVYVFSFDDTVPKEEFVELKGRVKLCPIPDVILHVYRRLFK